MKTPNYVLDAAYSYSQGSYDTKTLPAGTFVRPIQYEYLPRHVVNDDRWANVNRSDVHYCYTKYGIIPIPKHLVREV